MKPKLGVVFPQITDNEISDLTVEKISVSKNRRKVKILLGADASEYQAAKVESALKSVCKLSEAIVKIEKNESAPDRNVMIYEVTSDSNHDIAAGHSGPKIVGKANVSEMLYGRPIRDYII